MVREQLSRLAGLDVDVTVEPVPGDQDGLRWRTRQRFVALPDGRRGMRKHRSHDVVAGRRLPDRRARAPSHLVRGRALRGRRRDGFWQVHPGAPEVLVDDRARDAGAAAGGVGARPLRRRRAVRPRSWPRPSGPAGSVTAGRGRRRGVPSTPASTCPGADVLTGDVAAVLARRAAGAGRPRGARPAARPARSGPSWSRSPPGGPARSAYVACDPAALARDVAIFAEHGYRLGGLRAFDLFPMTHHVECVALLDRDSRSLHKCEAPGVKARAPST